MIKNLVLALFCLIFLTGCIQKQTVVDASLVGDIDFIESICKNQDFVKTLESLNQDKKDGDCSGLIYLINKKHNNIYFLKEDIYKFMPKSGRRSAGIYNFYKANKNLVFDNPTPGDLIFFHNTTKNTKNSKIKEITHIGVVKEVFNDGRVSFLHNTRGKNKIDYINLNKKNNHKIKNKIENSYIIRCSKNKISCLASNRFAGYGKIKR